MKAMPCCLSFHALVVLIIGLTMGAQASDYMVVDLSSGPSASNYPVSYLSAVPTGGWMDDYKTTKMVLRLIPAGTFTMGSPVDEPARRSDETQHQVQLTQPFYIGVFEVTQRQWARVMGTWPSYFTNASYRDSHPVEQVSYDMIRGSSAGSGWPTNSNVDADSFMGRLRVRSGKVFDLPTEAQWEYAGRAGTTTALNSGKDMTSTVSCPNMDEVGRYWWNGGAGYTENGDSSVGTAKVGSYLPNQWGLYDIQGNVWEWCLDWYEVYSGAMTDTTGATTGIGRMGLGGSWWVYADWCRIAARPNNPAVYSDKSSGFRVALPSAEPSLADGLVAYYPFNGNANDESGNGNNGTVYGAGLCADRFGNLNSAYRFNGEDSIRANSSPGIILGTTDFTISLWFTLRSQFPWNQHLISKVNGDRLGGWAFYVPANEDTIAWCTESLIARRISTVPENAWQHIVVTRSGAVHTFFLNGVQVDQATILNADYNRTNELLIGSGAANGQGFQGNLDEVRIYNRALSASEVVQLYMFGGESYAPFITLQPKNQTTNGGTSATFSVVAFGAVPMTYQWRVNGRSIAGATNATLRLPSVQASDGGGYSVVVANSIGSVMSVSASLAVVTVDTNSQPARIVPPPCVVRPPTKDSLVLVTHGFIPTAPGGQAVMPSWVDELCNTIEAKVPTNVCVANIDWSAEAKGLNPENALLRGELFGRLYGVKLKKMGWQHIHLIGHSAGAGLIDGIAREISGTTTVHETFLDPFIGFFCGGKGRYGASAGWSDCYFTQDGTGGFTGGDLDFAYNVDIDWVDPNKSLLPFGQNLVAFSDHEYSHAFYQQTVTNCDNSWCAKTYGFPLSKEGGGWINNQGDYPVGNGANPPVPCGLPGTIPSPNYPLVVTALALQSSVHAISDFGANIVGGAAFVLSSIPFPWQSQGKVGGVQLLDEVPLNGTNGPSWLAVGITVTSAVNFVSFDAAFTDTNAAEGLLTVYWNTNQIGMVDERVTSTNLETFRLPLPGTVTDGVYTLGFRLDSFTNTAASIMVTNVATGYSGLTNRLAMAIAVAANTQPLMALSGDAGFNYLVQTSTNMSDWIPFMLLANTNGTVKFSDSGSTNFNRRFYRAIAP